MKGTKQAVNAQLKQALLTSFDLSGALEIDLDGEPCKQVIAQAKLAVSIMPGNDVLEQSRVARIILHEIVGACKRQPGLAWIDQV